MKRFFLLCLVLLPSIVFWVQVSQVMAQSASLEDAYDIISTDQVNLTGVAHTVGFKLPLNGLSIDFTDYIQIDLPGFSAVTPATSIVGQYSGTPVFSVDGTTAKITGIFVLPGKTLTIRGITATNPALSRDMEVYLSVTTNEAGTLIKNYAAINAVTNPGTVAMTAEVDFPQATIRITGYTGPSTFVAFTEGENVIGTDLSSSLGVFSKVFTAVEPGDHEISLYGMDLDNRATSIVPLSINAPVYQTTTVSNILLSPTLEINSTEITQGQALYATGSAYPGTEVTVFTDTPLRTYTASTSASGDWTTTISDTANYTPGDYRLYTLAQDGALQSLTSRTLVFSVVSDATSSTGTACGAIDQGDLNCDSSINLTDFSILMYYWASTNAAADINADEVVNITDFSILMYYWGS